MVNDPGILAAVRELEAQRAAVADCLGSRAAEYARSLAVMTAERDALADENKLLLERLAEFAKAADAKP